MMTFEGFGRNKNSECVYLSARRFSMAWEKGIQVPFPFFVFAWHWKTNLNFAFCFSLSPNFEKRFCTSYFVFRFRITLKNGYEFCFSFFVFALLWKKKKTNKTPICFSITSTVQKGNSNPFFKVMRKRKSKNEIQIRFSKWSENEKRNTKFKSVFQS